jgi:hypothetical protein
MNRYITNSDFEQFKLIYRGGFVFAFGILILVGILHLPSFLLLIVGIIHIIFLVHLAYKVKTISYLVISAGNRIQTAGYLHTLIGFSAALLVLSEPNFKISDLAYPLATKLLTSLLGWFFGGEFIAEGETDDISLQKATRELVSEIQDYTNNLKGINQTTLNSMQSVANSHIQKMAQSHNTALNSVVKNYENCLGEIEKLLKEHKEKMNVLYIEVAKNSKSLNDAMMELTANVVRNSNSLSDSLDQASHKISEGSTKIKISVDEYDTILTEAKNHSKNFSINLSGLSNSLINFQNEIKKTITTANDLTTKIDIWAASTDSMTTQINSVIAHLKDLVQHIMSLTKRNTP